MDYPQLERIHYLLVAGFDVFGNLGHQVITRLYMDFLRMEGEANLLALLPPATRGALVKRWYRGLREDALKKVWGELLSFRGFARIRYRTQTPEQELFQAIEARLARVVSHRYDLARGDDPELTELLARLGRVQGLPASRVPETVFVRVQGASGDFDFSVLRDSAHSNVAQLFGEDRRRLPAEDGLTVVRGFLGAYPNTLFSLPRAQLAEFVAAVEALGDDAAYRDLALRYGVSRTDPHFWQHSDAIQRASHADDPLEAGLFDYNRLGPF